MKEAKRGLSKESAIKPALPGGPCEQEAEMKRTKAGLPLRNSGISDDLLPLRNLFDNEAAHLFR